MLWLIGFAAITIDLFNRLSVPVDVVLEYSSSHHHTTTPPPHLFEEVLIPHDPVPEPPHAVVLDERTINALLRKLNVSKNGAAKPLVRAIQGGVLYLNKEHAHDQEIETPGQEIHLSNLLEVHHQWDHKHEDFDYDGHDDAEDDDDPEHEQGQFVTQRVYESDTNPLGFLPLTSTKSKVLVTGPTTSMPFKAQMKPPKFSPKSGSGKVDPAMPPGEELYHGKDPGPLGGHGEGAHSENKQHRRGAHHGGTMHRGKESHSHLRGAKEEDEDAH